MPSLALLLVGGGWLLGGARAAFALLGPALLLYFAWPWPGVLMNRVIWALQMFAVDLASAILSGLGIAYEVSGDQILARQHTFQVIETCSGMRSLETLTIAAVAYCELFGRHGRRLWALVLSAPVIALLLNGVRVVTIILNPYSEVVAIHTLQGLVIIVLGVFAIAGVDSLLERLGWFPGGAPRMLRLPRDVPFRGPRWAALAAFLVVLSVASIVPLTASAPAPAVVPLMQRIPAVVGEWSSVPAKVDQGFLGSVYYTQMLRRDYKRGDEVITLFAAEDDRQQPAASLLSPKIAIGDTGWDTADESRVRVDALESSAWCCAGAPRSASSSTTGSKASGPSGRSSRAPPSSSTATGAITPSRSGRRDSRSTSTRRFRAPRRAPSSSSSSSSASWRAPSRSPRRRPSWSPEPRARASSSRIRRSRPSDQLRM